MNKPLNRYYIEVRGFDGHVVEAETASKARYADFKAWKEAGYGRRYSFGEFLKTQIETFLHLGRGKP